MFNLIPPWIRWAALGLVVLGAFVAGVKVEGWRRDSGELDRQVAITDALQDGWVAQNAETVHRDTLRSTTDQANDADQARLRESVREVRREIDHAPLVTVDQAAAVCPDPRGVEWLRLYGAAARGATDRAAPASPGSVPAGSP